MKTSHPFKFQMPNGFSVENLIPTTNMTFEDFCTNLDNLSFYCDCNADDFIESGMQSLVEAIIHFDTSIGITDYEPTNSTEHKEKIYGTGVHNGNTVTVFVAFKGKDFLTKGNSRLTEYLAQSVYEEGFAGGYYIFTDAQGIHENTKVNFLSNHEPHFYGKKEIQAIIDNNTEFWAEYRASFELEERQERPVIELYPRQEQVKNDLLQHSEGKFKVIWPTGTGKFEILMEHSIEHMRNLLNDGNVRPVCLTISPRLLLIKQCIQKMIARINQFGVENCLFINFTSSDYDNDGLLRQNYADIKEVITTTSITALKKQIKHHKGPVFIFTTYHSSEKIIDSGLYVDLMNCDEAHNIVKGRSIPEEARKKCVFENDNLPFKVFYTATQALSGTPDEPDEEGFGMDNTDLFGEYISLVSPLEMIFDGKIVRPFVQHVEVEAATLTKHGVNLEEATQEEITHNAELNAYIVCEAFEKVEEKNRKHSLNHEENAVKMLVRCSGGVTFDGMLNSKALAEFQAERPDVLIYAISSDHGTYIEGVRIKDGYNTKGVFIQEISNLSSDIPAIIFHIDMIGEGLDVPGITAILPFGRLNEITANQHLGRAMRLHLLDRMRLDAGEITSNDWCVREGKITKRGKFYKPICYIVLPVYHNTPYASDINRNCIQEMVKQIIYNLGYIPYEQYYESGYDGSVIVIPDTDKNTPEYVAENIKLDFTEPITFEQMVLFDLHEEARKDLRRREVEAGKNSFLQALQGKMQQSG